MQVYFGKNIKRLRREMGLTQEQLATRLNVSFQTISNWERDENWPDLSVLPMLAEMFGVKIDDLLGVNQAENERRIQELITHYENPTELIPSVRIPQYVMPLKAMLKEFPQEWRLWELYFGLMTSLCPDDTAECVRERLPEVRRIYDNILESCTNDAIRIGVKGTMCHFLIRIVQRDPDNCEAESAEIKKIIGELPDLLDSREYTSTLFLPGTLDECITACQEAIVSTLQMLDYMISHLGNNFAEGQEWNAAVLPLKQIGLAIYNAAFPDGAYGPLFGNVCGTTQHMIHGHAQKGNFDAAFAAIKRLIELSRRYDALPQRSELTSPLFQGYMFEKTGFHDFRALEGMREFMEGAERTWTFFNPWPEGFREDPRFGEILAELVE